MHKRYTQSGFTIVELLIVITVVVLLGLLTVFAFGNWRERTANTEVKSALTHAAGAVKDYANFNNAYPSSLPDTYKPTDGVTLNYYTDPSGYCIEGISTADTNIVWRITDDNQTPTQSTC